MIGWALILEYAMGAAMVFNSIIVAGKVTIVLIFIAVGWRLHFGIVGHLHGALYCSATC